MSELKANSYILDRFEWSIQITLELVFQMDGSEKWTIREKGCCLNKEGEWEIEPIPSSRDGEFLRRCRFDSLQDALIFWNQGHKSRFEHYRTRQGSQK